jgi:hypothetical protein
MSTTNLPQPIVDLEVYKNLIRSNTTYANLQYEEDDQTQNQINTLKQLFEDILTHPVGGSIDAQALIIPHQSLWYDDFNRMHVIVDSWSDSEYYHTLIHEAYEKYVACLQWSQEDNNATMYVNEYKLYILNMVI